MLNENESEVLLARLNGLASHGDPLMGDLASLLSDRMSFQKNYGSHVAGQGLPSGASLDELIQHHRNAGKLIGALDAYSELIAAYEPSPEELSAVVKEVYGPGTPEEWQLDNAKAALLSANEFRSKRF